MNGRYMGQIMAECDCKHSPFCEKRGYCMAERIGESDRAIANLQREYDKRGDRIEAMQAYIDAAEDVFDYELIFARKPKWTRLQDARDKLKEVTK